MPFSNLCIETSRLILRHWKEEDISAFARLNSDEHVMKNFLKTFSYDESMDFYNRIQAEFESCGYGLYAVERKEDHAFIGYVGLHSFHSHPCLTNLRSVLCRRLV